MFDFFDKIDELKSWQYVLIFLGLALFIALIFFAVKSLSKNNKGSTEDESAQDNASCSDADALNEPAPGRSGEMTLYNVTEREAVLVMAITAEKLQKPLNTLQFISIRKLEEK